MTQFIEGIFFNKPHEKAPEFVKLKLKINRDQLGVWLAQQDEEIYVDVKESKNGKWYGSVSDYKPQPKDEPPPSKPQSDDLPF